jgi:hypothetical protein
MARSAMISGTIGGVDIEGYASYHGPICVPAPVGRASSSSSTSRRATTCDGGNAAPSSSSSHHREYGAGTMGEVRRSRSSPPRKMSDSPSTYPVYFIHIGKAGGTSVDDLMTRIFKCSNRSYVGRVHYDWSYIRHRERLRRRTITIGNMDDDEYREHFRGDNGYHFDDDDDDVTSSADVVTFLRYPVSRALSQFEYSKTQPWAIGTNASFLTQTLDEYLDDEHKTWMQPISDGESGTDWLAGIFPSEDDGGGWILTDGKETRTKARLRSNRTASALLAARRLEKTAWFGLLEDVTRSMELLSATLGLQYVPIFPMQNSRIGRNVRGGGGGGKGGGKEEGQPPLSVETTRKIESYVPGDLWLYEYATRLFDARYEYFVLGEGRCPYIPPEMPPLPDFR